MQALSIIELNEVRIWFEKCESELPIQIAPLVKRMLSVYLSMSQGLTRAKATLHSLRQAMGIVPKSERGVKAKSAENLEFNIDCDIEAKEEYEEVKRKRAELLRQKAEYEKRLKKLRPKENNPQLEFDLARANEMMFSYPVSHRNEEEKKQKVMRKEEFGKVKGLHATHDHPMRLDVKLLVTQINYTVETVTDPETGKSVRASMADEGPEKFQFTWGAIATLIKLHVGFAIPINRMELMIGQPEFTSSKICRVLQYIAMNLSPVYLQLAEEIADSEILSGDDTSTKVLDISDSETENVSKKIDEHLDFISERADGKGDKKAINVSLLVGKSEKDPRSTIRFFRTHIGSVGNVLTRLLEWRSPKAGDVIFQGDLSSANLPSRELQEKFNLAIAGCGAHARRPFWRYKEQDESLCYFMLRGFLLLTQIEYLINAKGRTRENVLKLRTRYAKWVWYAMKNRSVAAVTGVVKSPGTYPKGILPNVWPPGTDLYKACMYVINHFESLTLYLTHPALQYTNNGSERALRIEKCMLSGSKFRKTKNGRAVLDILRTINSTCTAAEIDISDYLCYVFKHLDQLHDTPELFTPFAVARALEKKSANQPQPGSH